MVTLNQGYYINPLLISYYIINQFYVFLKSYKSCRHIENLLLKLIPTQLTFVFSESIKYRRDKFKRTYYIVHLSVDSEYMDLLRVETFFSLFILYRIDTNTPQDRE